MYLYLEVVKENIIESSAVIDSNPPTNILHNLNLTLPIGSRFLIIGANGSLKSTLLRILGGGHLAPLYSDVHVLILNLFCDTKLNFHCAYLDTNWGFRGPWHSVDGIHTCLCYDGKVLAFLTRASW